MSSIAMDQLRLEFKTQVDRTVSFGSAFISPNVEETYWSVRVMVSDRQAIVGFPKFRTIGIGFMIEKDWNTNLPYQVPAKEILKHIWHNAGQKLDRKTVLRAISMVRQAVLDLSLIPRDEALIQIAREAGFNVKALRSDEAGV